MGKYLNLKNGDIIGHCIYLYDVDVIRRARRAMFKCRCGKEFITYICKAKALTTKSCGCIKSEAIKNKHLKHGGVLNYKPSKEYRTWASIKQRCYNKKTSNYERYGGRGIIMSNEWKYSYIAFFKDMGIAPSQNHSIDRVDNSKGYSKENCRWATIEDQVRNKRNTVFISNGDSKISIPEICQRYGIKYKKAYYKYSRGLSFNDIITP